MILPLLLMQTAPAADVVVTAERLRKLRLATTVEHGQLTGCTVKVSSGDGLIDRVACQSMRACADSGIVASEALANCVDTRITAYVKERADAPAETK